MESTEEAAEPGGDNMLELVVDHKLERPRWSSGGGVCGISKKWP